MKKSDADMYRALAGTILLAGAVIGWLSGQDLLECFWIGLLGILLLP